MPHTADVLRRRARALILFLLGAAVFAAAYCQAPLYYSNQNQYFLHGLADAGEGLLREDWLANTRDPTPAFTALVALTARFLHPGAFYVYYALLLGAYAAAMLGLFVAVAGREVAARRWPAFVALFAAAHAALPRWCSYQWLGLDYPWYFQSGLAGQYLLGSIFQPSTFGVLLIGAVYLFVRGRTYPAVVCAALAVLVHSTYLLPAGLLTAGMLAALVREGHGLRAARAAVWAVVLVLPAVAYVLVTFGPTTPKTFAAAQDVVVNFRIPHHARPDLWLDPVAGLQIAWVVLGTVLARPPRLVAVLAVPTLLALLLTVLQVATGNDSLALLFPWRVSVVLVPVATTVILARLVAVRSLPLAGRTAWLTSAAVVAVLAAGGVWISVHRLGFHAGDEELPVMDFVRRTKQPGDVYLLPVRVPDLAATTRGSQSSDFKPLPDKQRDDKLVPVDLQRFRLTTGAPIFVDFKAIPYQDVEVLEWYARLRQAEAWQEQIRQGRLESTLPELPARGVTHLVLPTVPGRRGDGWEKVYEDPYYQVYRLTAAGEADAGR
jgi:hypothetical protein